MRIRVKQCHLRNVETMLAQDGWSVVQGRGKGVHKVYRDQWGTTISIAPKGNKMDPGMIAGLARQVLNAHELRSRYTECPPRPVILDYLIYSPESKEQEETQPDTMMDETYEDTAVEVEEATQPKVCKNCKLPKDLDQFMRSPHTADGRHDWCKKCFSEQGTKKRYAKQTIEKAAPESDECTLGEWLELAVPSLFLLSDETLPGQTLCLRFDQDTVFVYSTKGAGFTDEEGKPRALAAQDVVNVFRLFTPLGVKVTGRIFH